MIIKQEKDCKYSLFPYQCGNQLAKFTINVTGSTFVSTIATYCYNLPTSWKQSKTPRAGLY